MLFKRMSQSRTESSPGPAGALGPLPGANKSGSNGSPGSARTQSFIDASLTITGDLHSDGDVQLDGRICGNVRCAQLIVGKDGAITGAVAAEQAIVRGRITGTIRSPVVILQDTARVESEITYTLLAVDDGATFEGAARRSESPLEEEEEKTAASLVELQRMMLAAGSSSGIGKREANGTEAVVAPPAVSAADGHARTENKPS